VHSHFLRSYFFSHFGGKYIRLDEYRERISVREIINKEWGQPVGNYLVVDNKVSHRGIIDFSEYPGGGWTVADISYLDIKEGNVLILRNMKLNHSIFLPRSYAESLFDRIAYELNGKMYKVRMIDYIEYWPTKKGWTYLRPTGTPWVPTPESETYGAIFGALGLGLVGWRRKVRRARASIPA